MKMIKLYNGQMTIVDDWVFDWAAWIRLGFNKHGYVRIVSSENLHTRGE